MFLGKVYGVGLEMVLTTRSLELRGGQYSLPLRSRQASNAVESDSGGSGVQVNSTELLFLLQQAQERETGTWEDPGERPFIPLSEYVGIGLFL